jgi:alkyldihydroxyacetonephosphate synthase
MRRWNGWGDVGIDYHLPQYAVDFLSAALGEGAPSSDAELNAVLASVPSSRLPVHPAITVDAHERLLHARGQSLPDWIALRSGQIGAFPDAVSYPNSDEDVRSLMTFARQAGASLIPYGGGTSVVGHVNPRSQSPPCLTVDLSRMNQLLDLDHASQLATFEAGVRGPDLEAQLAKHGYTLGHYPQSFELSTLGGWIATRSSGQQSLYYGRIEDHFAGGHVEALDDSWDIPPFPASAAGPDLRHFLLGSEGRLGIITRATLRVRPIPEIEQFHAVFFRDWSSGVEAVRDLAQTGIDLSMLRLSDEVETQTTLALAGRERLVSFADHGLRLLGHGNQRCLLLFGVTGTRRETRVAQRSAKAIVRNYGGLHTGTLIGEMWKKSRFHTPYLRNTLWELGYALDTVETATTWSRVPETLESICSAIRSGLETAGERVFTFAHLSHIYRHGASIYVTYLFRRATTPEETLSRWKILKALASEAIVTNGGTISHQHGVGLDHAEYLHAEKGPLGMKLLSSAFQSADADMVMNPGKLLPE